MKTICGCGKFMRDYGGVSGVGIEECEYCSVSGDYTKSPFYNHARDEADDRKSVAYTKYNKAMENVKPLKKDRRKAA